MLLLLLQRFWVHIAIAVVFSVAGYQSHRLANKVTTNTTKETLTQSKQVEFKKELLKAPSVIDRVVVKTITKAGKPKTVFKERIVTGPVSEVTTSKSEVETNTSKQTTVTSSQNMARYSLGLAIASTAIMQPSLSDVVVDVGIRLGNLPLWLTGSYAIQGKAVVGLRFEF